MITAGPNPGDEETAWFNPCFLIGPHFVFKDPSYIKEIWIDTFDHALPCNPIEDFQGEMANWSDVCSENFWPVSLTELAQRVFVIREAITSIIEIPPSLITEDSFIKHALKEWVLTNLSKNISDIYYEREFFDFLVDVNARKNNTPRFYRLPYPSISTSFMTMTGSIRKVTEMLSLYCQIAKKHVPENKWDGLEDLIDKRLSLANQALEQSIIKMKRPYFTSAMDVFVFLHRVYAILQFPPATPSSARSALSQ